MRLALRVLAVLVFAPAAALAQPDEKPKQGPADYFPTEVGRQWTYELRITAGKTTQSIIYTTRVIAHQEVPKVGVCAVFQSSSGSKLLAMDWYKADREVLKNPKRQRGKQVVTFPDRVLLNRSALVRLPKLPALTKRGAAAASDAKTAPAPAAKTDAAAKASGKTSKTEAPTRTAKTEAASSKTAQPVEPTRTASPPTPKPRAVRRSWAWRADGSLKAAGKIRVIGRQQVRLRYYGTLDCVVIEDTGAFEAGGKSRTQWRRLWLAPQIGLVREVTEIRDGETVTFATEAHLMRHE